MQNYPRGFEGKTHGAEHADDAENRCGKTNEHMSWSMHLDIDIIGGNRRHEHGQQTNAVAGEVEKKMKEKDTENAVT